MSAAQLNRIEQMLAQLKDQKIDKELTATQVHEEYGWPVPTIHYWRDEGLLPSTQKTKGGKHFFKRSDCDRVHAMTKPERRQAAKKIKKTLPSVTKSANRDRLEVV